MEKKELKNRDRHIIKSDRQQARWLLFAYDLLFFTICYVPFYVFHISSSKEISTLSLLVHYLLAGLFLFGSRFSFRVYHLIWRNGGLKAFACLIIADILGGVVYMLIANPVFQALQIGIDAVSYVTVLAFVASNLLLCLIMRILYFYLYHAALRDTDKEHRVRNFVQTLTMTDFDSQSGGIMRLVMEPDNRYQEAINETQRVVRQFAIRGRAVHITQLNSGYINRTYRVETENEQGEKFSYILQRINTYVFRNPEDLMENYQFVTEHLRGRYHLQGTKMRNHFDEGVPMLCPTKDGLPYLSCDSGSWRMITCIDNTYGINLVEKPETFYYAGTAFGKFVREMKDVPQEKIHITIPDFHNIPKRMDALKEAIEENVMDRVKEVPEEIAFILQREKDLGILHEALTKGEIPVRICHNDTNLNNILFDKDTDLPVAIVDLDTVMPSTPLYDFGDSMRAGTNTATDDEKDLSKVSCDLNLYEKYARGYLEACGKILTQRELELLPYAASVITAEDGVRFLTDHIVGDVYFKIFYPNQNLDRCRTQFALLRDMEEKLPQMKEILQQIYDELGLKAKLL